MSLSVDDFLGLYNATVTGDKPAAAVFNRYGEFLTLLLRVFLREVVQDGILRSEPPRATYYYYTSRILQPTLNLPILGICGGYPILMGSDLEQDGTVATGATTSLTDSGLAGSGNHWVRAYVIFTSGANDGEVRRVTAYDETLHRLTWSEELVSAPLLGDTYTVTFFYVSEQTPSATNYVFARKGSDMVSRGIVEFYASTSPTVPDNELLLASALLDGNGDCISYDDHPTGAARDLWAGVGQYKTLSGSGTVENVPAGESVEVNPTHDQLLFLGGLTVSLDTEYYAYGSVEVTEHYRDAEFKFTITNNTESPCTFNYAWERSGRVMSYA